jgi:hypothetical protein
MKWSKNRAPEYKERLHLLLQKTPEIAIAADRFPEFGRLLRRVEIPPYAGRPRRLARIARRTGLKNRERNV